MAAITPADPRPPMIRPATLDDLDALVAIEERCFDLDRLSRRSFRHLLTRGHALTLVAVHERAVCGYGMLLFHEGTSLGRLYSFAVDPACRGLRYGQRLLQACERAALARDCVTLRLEVRPDNAPAIRLYEAQGYRRFGVHEDYYEDHAEAWRYEKNLAPHLKPDRVPVPYYRQTLDFTCGPAALMMAMKALQPRLALDRKLELRLWRESTTVFMTSGHGGCGPYGLALAAWQRGFDVEVFVNDEGALFIDSVRSPDKKVVITLVQEDFLEQLRALPVPLRHGAASLDQLQAAFADGGIPIVLISSYRIYREKFPHWVVVTGFDERYVYVHDPFVDADAGKTRTDCINMPILKKDFQRMARYGKAGQRAALVLRRRLRGARRPVVAAS
ncbi:MAG: GNAT family N-acetyltransferase/peptidase C39 family protein [Pseudomonadota bacterium]